MGKIVQKQEFKKIRDIYRTENKKVMLCHGVFDLVHPGHILHFEEAKSLGDVLVVSITAAAYVRKGPGRPYFNDELRLKFLSEISCIDYVMLSESYTVDDIIEVVEPDLYVKGQEYAKSEDDITGMIDAEVEVVRRHGGDVCFTNGQVFSSTKLINNFMPSISDEVKDFMQEFIKKYQFSQIQDYIEKMKQLKVLVVGDVIIDNYVYCDMQGLMSKDRGYSVRYKEEQLFLGGSLAIARHLAQFSDNVTLSSIIGNENEIHSLILNNLGKEMKIDLECSEEYKTISKKRFIIKNKKREEFDKVFSINNLPDNLIINGEAKDNFKKRLSKILKEYDLVVLCDFGHGLIDKEVQALIEDKAKFLAVNCQTNSSNYGMNLITKYKRADIFTLDQREIKLAFQNNIDYEIDLLKRLSTKLHSKVGVLTQASSGATGIDTETQEITTCPALTLKVKDTIGAGDALFAIASICTAGQVPYDVSTFLGNVAGALASNIVGNEKPVNKVDFLKYVHTLMNF